MAAEATGYWISGGIESDIDADTTDEAIERLIEEYEAQIPDVLFDGYSVMQALSKQAQARTSAENVSDVLDAVVRVLRAALAAREKPE